MISELAGKFVGNVVPGKLLLNRLGRWYEGHEYHKFDEGDILVLKERLPGFGKRPVAIVNEYAIKDTPDGKRGRYDITVHKDKDGNYFRWMGANVFPQGVERIVSENEIYPKWNIENRFKKVSVETIDEAVALYESKGV
ncbi:MAG: hypothetical protein GY861_09460 [bacterium]|nr:hypothetical protein [bacterium]